MNARALAVMGCFALMVAAAEPVKKAPPTKLVIDGSKLPPDLLARLAEFAERSKKPLRAKSLGHAVAMLEKKGKTVVKAEKAGGVFRLELESGEVVEVAVATKKGAEPLRVPHEKELVPRPPAVIVPGPGDDPKPETKSAVVPSCVRTGNTIHDFALKDYDGNDWLLRKVCEGKVVLLSFWKPGCAPCIAAIPKLADLQRSWSDKGLQVVGVMCETKGTLPARQQAVRTVWQEAKVKEFNYPVLFSETFDCPVIRDFKVGVYPTLVLLDEKGKILGRWEGWGEKSLEEALAGKLGR